MALVANMATSDGTPLGVSIANFDRLRRSTEGMAVYLLGTFVRQMYDMAGEIPSVADLVRRTGAWGDHEAATRGVFRMLARDHPGVDRHRFRDWFWWWLSLFGGITFGVAVWGPALDDDDEMQSGTRLKVSNALKKVYDSKPQARKADEAEDFVIGVTQPSLHRYTLRIEFQDLPPLLKELVEETARMKRAMMEGMRITIFNDQFLTDTKVDYDSWLESMDTLHEVEDMLLERFGMERLEPPEVLESGAEFDDLEGLLVPGSDISVQTHAENIVKYNLAFEVVFHRELTLENLVLSINHGSWLVGMDMSPVDYGALRKLPAFAQEAYCAQRFVENWQSIRKELRSINPRTPGVFSECDRSMPSRMKLNAPRFVFWLDDDDSDGLHERVAAWRGGDED